MYYVLDEEKWVAIFMLLTVEYFELLLLLHNILTISIADVFFVFTGLRSIKIKKAFRQSLKHKILILLCVNHFKKLQASFAWKYNSILKPKALLIPIHIHMTLTFAVQRQ